MRRDVGVGTSPTAAPSSGTEQTRHATIRIPISLRLVTARPRRPWNAPPSHRHPAPRPEGEAAGPAQGSGTREQQPAAAGMHFMDHARCRARDQGPLRAPPVEGITASRPRVNNHARSWPQSWNVPPAPQGREQQQDAGPGTKVHPSCPTYVSPTRTRLSTRQHGRHVARTVRLVGSTAAARTSRQATRHPHLTRTSAFW